MSDSKVPPAPPSSLVQTATALIYSISFYSPLAVIMAVMYWGFSVGGAAKSFAYLAMVLLIIVIRTCVFSGGPVADPPAACRTALTLPNDALYSVFLLSFTLFYLLAPMFLSGSYNFGAIGFFGSYFVADVVIRLSLKCVDTYPALMQSLMGAMVGLCVGFALYSFAKSLVFVNIVNTANGEVCTMPSAQQFKCSVYKNGELVSS